MNFFAKIILRKKRSKKSKKMKYEIKKLRKSDFFLHNSRDGSKYIARMYQSDF